MSRFRRVAVFGAGISGKAARRLAMRLGLEVCLFDEGGKGDCSEFNEQLLQNFDAFIFSPGFAAAHPWRVLAENRSSHCYGELGFAALHWRGNLLGVTGTNGKSTITALLQEALVSTGIDAIQAGNNGLPLSDYIFDEKNHRDAYAVCEISSFQAELSQGLELDGFIWSNFAEDHLDRYASMTDYFSAKKKLLSCLRPDAPVCLGADVLVFDTTVAEIPNVIVVDGDPVLIKRLSPDSPFVAEPQSTNFVLTAMLWRALGFSESVLTDAANDFQLAAHRLSPLCEWGGATFWNDSKATNFHAALAAINAMKDPVYWIGGGSYKGGDVEAFIRAVAEKVEVGFLYGTMAEQLADHYRQTQSMFEVHVDFVEATRSAAVAALANPPSCVLLSPGFASFDQFSGYGARGKAFVSTILNLKDSYCPE